MIGDIMIMEEIWREGEEMHDEIGNMLRKSILRANKEQFSLPAAAPVKMVPVVSRGVYCRLFLALVHVWLGRGNGMGPERGWNYAFPSLWWPEWGRMGIHIFSRR